MKTITGQQGFSIVGMLTGLGVITIGMMAVADMLVLNARVQRNSTSDSEIRVLFDRVQKIAGAEWSCTAGLAGSSPGGAMVVRDPLNAAAVVATEGTASGRFWTLTQVRLLDVQAVAGQPGVLRGTLYLMAAKDTRLHVGSPVLSRTLEDIYFETNPDGTIARCYTTSDTIAAAQSACQLLGGTWNPDVAEGSRCQLGAGG